MADSANPRSSSLPLSPTLKNLIEDPLTRALMERDGVRMEDLCIMLASARSRTQQPRE